MFGIDEFTAIINPPDACILAVGGIQQNLWKKTDKLSGSNDGMKVTLSCDHRVVDGASGSEFLRTLKGLLWKSCCFTWRNGDLKSHSFHTYSTFTYSKANFIICLYSYWHLAEDKFLYKFSVLINLNSPVCTLNIFLSTKSALFRLCNWISPFKWLTELQNENWFSDDIG